MTFGHNEVVDVVVTAVQHVDEGAQAKDRDTFASIERTDQPVVVSFAGLTKSREKLRLCELRAKLGENYVGAVELRGGDGADEHRLQ